MPALDIGADLVKPYKLNNQTVDQTLELKHGNASKTWNMDKVSNTGFTAVRYLHIESSKFPNQVDCHSIVRIRRSCSYRKSLIDY